VLSLIMNSYANGWKCIENLGPNFHPHMVISKLNFSI
jgi:hypothetical protein